MKLFIVLGLLALTACGGVTNFVGPKGDPGVAGKDGTVVTLVQLCSSCVTHYPDTFAEIAICSGGVLYGTYSSNGGFSSVLPPGAYSSNGINCSCTVTIGPNCSIN